MRRSGSWSHGLFCFGLLSKSWMRLAKLCPGFSEIIISNPFWLDDDTHHAECRLSQGAEGWGRTLYIRSSLERREATGWSEKTSSIEYLNYLTHRSLLDGAEPVPYGTCCYLGSGEGKVDKQGISEVDNLKSSTQVRPKAVRGMEGR